MSERNKTTKLIEQLKQLSKDNEYTIDELMEKVEFKGTLPTFRTLCWRYGISFKKKSRVGREAYDFSILDTLKTSEMTLTEIKEKMNYKGGEYALQKILFARGYAYKHREKTYGFKQQVLERVKNIDTTLYTPQQIFNLIGLSTINPASYLRTIGVEYKTR